MKRIIEMPLEEFEDLINRLNECLQANKALNEQIKEYNKKFATKETEKNDA